MRLRTAGFTLVELVIAFVLLAMGIVAILELVGQSALNARLARNRTQAALLAQQQMEELLSQPDLQPGVSEGDFGDRFPQFRWRAQIEQVSGSTDPMPKRPSIASPSSWNGRKGRDRKACNWTPFGRPCPSRHPSPQVAWALRRHK
jgi:type II secretion system protein I